MIANKELLRSIEIPVVIDVAGKSEQEMFVKAFKQITPKIHEHINGYLVKMNVNSVVVESFERETYIKKFLWLFMPVEHERFTMRINFKVEINYIEKGN